MKEILQIDTGSLKLWHGKHQLRFVEFAPKTGKIKAAEINEYLTKVSKKMQANGMQGTLYAGANYTSYNKYPTSKFNIGDDIDILSNNKYWIGEQENENEDIEFERFRIIIRQTNNVGKTSINNNCFYDCLEQVFGIGEVPYFTDGKNFRKIMKLKPDDGISITQIPDIESRIKTNIDVVGDLIYESPRMHSTLITIKLHNGHYTLAKEKNKIKNRGVAYEPKKKENVLVYITDPKDNSKYIGYYQNKYVSIAYDELKPIKANPRTCNELLIYADKKLLNILGLKEDASLKEIHDKFIKIADNLIEVTNGLINLYCTGAILKKIVLSIFEKTCLFTLEAEPIDQIESEWIQVLGPLIFATEQYNGPVYSYDMNTAHGKQMINKTHTFPLVRGVPTLIEDEPKFYQYGIYRAKVTRSNTKRDFLFRFNSDNKYSHIDLYNAQRLGLKVKLIKDGKVNAMLYPKRIAGNKLFGGYYKALYQYKYDDKLLPESKIIVKSALSSLWGALCEKNITNTFQRDNEDVHIDEDQEIDSINEINGKLFIRSYPIDQPFVHNYGRIGIFVLSYIRSAMAEYMLPCLDSVVKSHTDSILSKVPLTHLNIGKDIGDWKVEYEGLAYVCNVNKVLKVHIKNADKILEFFRRDTEYYTKLINKNPLNFVY